MGNGMPSTMESPANSEFPPPDPRASNSCCPNRGKRNPRMQRRTDAAARADAAYVNVSTRYSTVERLST